MARGRKAKTGKRTKSGRLKRNNYPAPVFDKGSDWVQAMRVRFGDHYSTALGRAFAAGLLGEGQQAADRFQAGKRFVRLYRLFYGAEHYRSPLDDTPRGNVVSLSGGSDAVELDRAWLDAAIDSMDVAGVRPYFDQLTSSLYTDQGPYWLDNLLSVQAWNADYARWNREDLPRINRDLVEKGQKPIPKRDEQRYDSRDWMVLIAAVRALDIMAPERKQSRIIAVTY